MDKTDDNFKYTIMIIVYIGELCY